MTDRWRMFPVTMGDDQAFISYNDSFSERAKDDPRRDYVRVEVALKDPTEAGLPQGEEFKALSKLDDALEAAFGRLGGVYVGRITVAGRRFFYFYLDASEAQAREAAGAAARPLSYTAQISWAEDPQKSAYWRDLYPTADDWRVIKDMDVLEALAQAGDNADVARTVQHWAYFDAAPAADAFRGWLPTQGLACTSTRKEEGGKICVQFTHEGVMHLAEITNVTLRCRRKAEELGGEYDGWETSVQTG